MRHLTHRKFWRIVVHCGIGVSLATIVAQAAGLLATTSVSFAAMQPDEAPGSYTVANDLVVDWRETSGPGRRQIWWALGSRGVASDGFSVGPRSLIVGRRRPEQRPPWWSRLGDARGIQEGVVMLQGGGVPQQYDYAVGWPVVSFRFERVDKNSALMPFAPYGTPKGAAREFWVSPTSRFARDSIEPRFVTFNPIWPGLAASSVFWGLVSFVAHMTVRTGIERSRRARGRCPSCGYDKRGLDTKAACPECGVSGPTGQSLP